MGSAGGPSAPLGPEQTVCLPRAVLFGGLRLSEVRAYALLVEAGEAGLSAAELDEVLGLGNRGNARKALCALSEAGLASVRGPSVRRAGRGAAKRYLAERLARGGDGRDASTPEAAPEAAPEGVSEASSEAAPEAGARPPGAPPGAGQTPRPPPPPAGPRILPRKPGNPRRVPEAGRRPLANPSRRRPTTR